MWTCSPRIRSLGLCSIRLISSAAAAGARPNFDPAWPVSTLACVSAVTPGMTRTRTSCRRPGWDGRLEPIDVVAVVDDDQTDFVLNCQGDLGVGLRIAVQHEQCRIGAGLECSNDLPASGDVESEAFLGHDPLHRGAGERLGSEHDA